MIFRGFPGRFGSDTRAGAAGGNGPPGRMGRLPLPAARETLPPTHNVRATEPMAEKKTAGRPGRKAPDGEKKQFLTSMDPDVIRRVKAAAALRDKTASFVLEEAAREWLIRHQDGKK